jgi:hypothetical protein
MNTQFQSLAKQAEFEFWEDESWRPPGQLVDWSSDYDKELQKFGELVVEESIKIMKQHDYHAEWLGEKIKEHFGIKL